ncbi:agmatine deiminase [Mesorhizobium sp. SARCC-RB16n]|uniref:agmatine deiminase n=1 Tax=Mesorhizobium sp. SARCC-RB16n TaxID=2116687 RepID=UPI00122F5884|nr:agmatine deiminase [Mesorhizobium sp. SARCC-RB16n]KAA3450838.1 agmatine deiminase [Mesorhizobium sp. SARCC-RB16n]
MSHTLSTTPRQDGFRAPGEFEPKSGCWLIWPERPDTWRLGAKPAQKLFANVAAAIAQSEPVTVAASGRQWQNARARLPSHVRVVEMSTNDSWLRDSGPNFVVNDRGEVRGVDWIFNAYGGFDGGLYSPWDLDDLAAQKVLEVEQMDRYRAPLIAEGGGLQCDGQGTLITTEQCLLNRNRNADLGKAKVEQQLGDYLGVDKIIWLPRGFAFDETDGHVDDLCCFVRPGVVALSWTEDRKDPQYEIVREAEEVLRSARDARGRALEVYRLPHPLPIEMTMEESESVDRVDSTWARPTGNRIAASYINYYPGNSVVVVPEFGCDLDRKAKLQLAMLFPDHKIIGIENSREILLGGGNVACITLPVYAPQRC